MTTDIDQEAQHVAETMQNLEMWKRCASPASQIRSVQATTMAHLANVTHAEAAFRACTWNLLVYLAQQPYTDVVVSRRADKSAMGPVTIVDLWFKVGHFTFKSEAVSHVEENNGFINVTLA
jgi:hypothetical protein